MSIVERIKQNLIDGHNKKVGELTAAALEEGLEAKQLLDDGLIAGMEVVGVSFRDRRIFLPEVLLAARAMYAGLDLLQPLLEGDLASSKGRIVIGTVEGDLHDIGKNLVGIMLRGAGFEVIDLGNSVSPAKFVEAVRQHNASIVGLSALLTTTMPVMKRIVDALKDAGLSDVKTIIGGAPVSQEYADQIGADAYGYDAVRSVEIVKDFV